MKGSYWRLRDGPRSHHQVVQGYIKLRALRVGCFQDSIIRPRDLGMLGFSSWDLYMEIGFGLTGFTRNT